MISGLFEQFIEEKRYLNNRSERMLHSYRSDMFRRWMLCVGGMPTQAGINQFVMKMREGGLAISTGQVRTKHLSDPTEWAARSTAKPPIRLLLNVII
jgi:hypothetical protein